MFNIGYQSQSLKLAALLLRGTWRWVEIGFQCWACPSSTLSPPSLALAPPPLTGCRADRILIGKWCLPRVFSRYACHHQFLTFFAFNKGKHFTRHHIGSSSSESNPSLWVLPCTTGSTSPIGYARSPLSDHPSAKFSLPLTPLWGPARPIRRRGTCFHVFSWTLRWFC